jgi:hypothetical protein
MAPVKLDVEAGTRAAGTGGGPGRDGFDVAFGGAATSASVREPQVVQNIWFSFNRVPH